MTAQGSEITFQTKGGEVPFKLGDWHVEPETGRLTDESISTQLEPQLMALLLLLVSEAGRVLSRQRIEKDLWPDTIVGEDTLARAISRLRRALNDSAQTPRYIETLPKRGYRLIAPVADVVAPLARANRHNRLLGLAILVVCVAVIAWLMVGGSQSDGENADQMAVQVARADDYYMRFTRADNEAAIGLYEGVLVAQPDNNRAHAGMANALVQRVVRWPRNDGVAGATSLAEALARGLTSAPDAEAILMRAAAMAERAVRIAPADPAALKSLAFVKTAQGDLDSATALYQQVLTIDADAWASLINLGEIALMRDDERAAVAFFEKAWDAMARTYDQEPQRIGPWQAPLGVAIGESHERLGQRTDAEIWYRRVLARTPYQPEATIRLAELLAAQGARDEAVTLCHELTARVGAVAACDWAQ